MSIAEIILRVLRKDKEKTREQIRKILRKLKKNDDVLIVWDTLIRFQKQRFVVENMKTKPFRYLLTDEGLERQRKITKDIKARP